MNEAAAVIHARRNWDTAPFFARRSCHVVEKYRGDYLARRPQLFLCHSCSADAGQRLLKVPTPEAFAIDRTAAWPAPERIGHDERDGMIKARMEGMMKARME